MRFASMLRTTLAATMLLGALGFATSAYADDDRPGNEGQPFDLENIEWIPISNSKWGLGLASEIADIFKAIPKKPKLQEFVDQEMVDEGSGPCIPGLPELSTAALIPDSVGIAGFNLKLPRFDLRCKYNVRLAAGKGHLKASGYVKVRHEFLNVPEFLSSVLDQKYEVSGQAHTDDSNSSIGLFVVIANEVYDDYFKSAPTAVYNGGGWVWDGWSDAFSYGATILGQRLRMGFDTTSGGQLTWDFRASVVDTHAIMTGHLYVYANLNMYLNDKVVAGTGLQLFDDTVKVVARAYPKAQKNKDTGENELRLCAAGNVSSEGAALKWSGVSFDALNQHIEILKPYGGISLNATFFDKPETCTPGVPYHL